MLHERPEYSEEEMQSVEKKNINISHSEALIILLTSKLKVYPDFLKKITTKFLYTFFFFFCYDKNFK